MDIQKISNAVTGTMIVIKATIPERFACEDIQVHAACAVEKFGIRKAKITHENNSKMLF